MDSAVPWINRIPFWGINNAFISPKCCRFNFVLVCGHTYSNFEVLSDHVSLLVVYGYTLCFTKIIPNTYFGKATLIKN